MHKDKSVLEKLSRLWVCAELLCDLCVVEPCGSSSTAEPNAGQVGQLGPRYLWGLSLLPKCEKQSLRGTPVILCGVH